MSKLLEGLLKNKQKQTLSEFDMSRTGNAMLRYLGKGYPDDNNDVPIEPKSMSWEQFSDYNKNYLKKSYDLETIKFLLYFVNEIIMLSEEMFHHPDILIQNTNVTIKLYTHDLNDITDRDIQMSKKIDEIFQDISIIKFR